MAETHQGRPPVSVEVIAAYLGIAIARDPLPRNDVSGFYLRAGNRRVIGVNSAHPGNRQRFTIAHEIGHAVLADHDQLHVDRVTRWRNGRSSEGTDPLEVEANRFAADLLMPQEMLERHLQANLDLDVFDQDDVRRLADAFGVSVQAMLIRLSDLDLVSFAPDSPW